MRAKSKSWLRAGLPQTRLAVSGAVMSWGLPNRQLDYWSILEVLTLQNGVAARQAIPFRAQCIRHVVARDDHVVELPDWAVALHAGDGVVDVELTFYNLRWAHAAALLVELDLVDHLVLLGDLHLARVDGHTSEVHGEDQFAVAPDPFHYLAKRI